MTNLDLDIISLSVISLAALSACIYVPWKIRHDTEIIYANFRARHMEEFQVDWIRLIS